MGTIGYMSPEQVRGTASDAWSDIFNFGTVLYKMLTGKRAFKRDTAAETMAAILREEPPELNETGWQGPIGLHRILGRCLEKNVERRFQSASDLAFAIEAPSGTATSAAQTVERPKATRAWLPWLAIILGGLALAAAMWMIGPAMVHKSSAEIHPADVSAGLSLQRAICERPADSGVQRPMGKQSSADLHRAHGISAINQGGFAERHIAGTFRNRRYANCREPRVPHEFSEWHAGAGGYGWGHTACRGEWRDCSGLHPGWKDASGGTDGEPESPTGISDGKSYLYHRGYIDYVRVSPSGKELAFLEHPVFDDDRGWVATIDKAGKHKQLTKEFGTVQGLAWSRGGREIWFTANNNTTGATDRQLFGGSLGGKQREMLTTPYGTRLMDVAGDGRVLLCGEELRSEISGLDPSTGKERRGLEWFNGSGLGDISPDGKAILFDEWGGPAGSL